MINVTKSYLPDIEDYIIELRKIWASGHLTNHGPMVNKLEHLVKDYLGVKYFFYMNNGTIAIQIALKACGVQGEVITTPFSYVATTGSVVWENAVPVFTDINERNYTLDATKIEAAITERTTAILATHVYGIPCDVEAIEAIARKHNLKVIYDAAHAFGTRYKGEGLLSYGDCSTVSFHATKLFHTVEGGGVATNDPELAHKISYMRNFGHNGPEDFYGVGINGKSSEFHAAMGLCLIDRVPELIAKRKVLSDAYEKFLKEEGADVTRPIMPEGTEYNYAYFPIVFPSESKLLEVKNRLNSHNIYPRRYFYPSLNTLNYVTYSPCPVSEDICTRVLCLPLYPDLAVEQVSNIVSKITA